LSAYYVDASAFVKLVVDEPSSGALRDFLRPKDRRPLVSSAILVAEALRAVRVKKGPAVALAQRMLRTVQLIPLDNVLLARAGLLDPVIVRTLDAIHLASAMEIGPDLDGVITYDRRMAEAAATLGLATLSPS
jgi:predicted nucleic acid-binding protein